MATKENGAEHNSQIDIGHNSPPPLPHVVRAEDGSLRIRGSAEQIQTGVPVKTSTLNDEEEFFVPGEFLQSYEDGTQDHAIQPVPRITLFSGDDGTYVGISGDPSQLEKGLRVQGLTPTGKMPTVFLGDVRQQSSDGTVVREIIPEIRSFTDIGEALVGLTSQITKDVSIRALDLNDRIHPIIPGNLICEFDDGTAAFSFTRPSEPSSEDDEHKRRYEEYERFCVELLGVNEQPELVQVVKSRLADVHAIMYFGRITDEGFEMVQKAVEDEKSRKNNKEIFVTLTTSGGYPDAAYRMVRLLRRKYNTITAHIVTRCKSAGTLVVIGADAVVMDTDAEIGPLDIQLSPTSADTKATHLAERQSSLNLPTALREIPSEFVSSTLLKIYDDLIAKGFTSARSLSVATKMTVDLFKTIYAKVDPANLGEIIRAIQIIQQYGEDLPGNLREGALKKLVLGYSSHGFVIDVDSAKELFKELRTPHTHPSPLGTLYTTIYKACMDYNVIPPAHIGGDFNPAVFPYYNLFEELRGKIRQEHHNNQ